ncbi:MAG: PLP-dependent aspartate aminotransferase family protein [Flavobacteriales bacterium]|jgi:cystathionine beta-lyase|tara:strand:+ start:1176 stop:2327 length:1152 start_codon:yes stop_codon:yes gene_type:complete
MKKDMKFGTKCIHAGVEPDPSTGAIMTPIFQTSTYVQTAVGEHKGYSYARSSNPTRSALESALAVLENGNYGLCFGSGMAAIDNIIKTLRPGDEVISIGDVYGGTYRIFTTVFSHYGITFNFINLTDGEALKPHLTDKTKLVWLETPTNPTLKIADIHSIAEVTKAHGALLAVDNTFATPYNQTPLDLGADIVMHSVTKYLGGHSDTVMGALICNDDALARELYRLQNSCGAIPGPQDCFLALRGLKTLHLRMKQHAINAGAVATMLSHHPKVDKVYYPGLVHSPGHKVATTQMRTYGGMVSFTLKEDSRKAAHNVLAKCEVFTLAESLGGVESLIGHPATMTHASIPKETREQSGITDSLIRLSVGVEDTEDILEDLRQAIG